MGCKRSEVQILSPRLVEEIHAITVILSDMTVFFMPRIKTTEKWSLASVALRDAYTDFVLARQAMNCTASTLDFYKYTAGQFLEWIEQRGIADPQDWSDVDLQSGLVKVKQGKGKKDRSAVIGATTRRVLLA